jgi:hypothetical protein
MLRMPGRQLVLDCTENRGLMAVLLCKRPQRLLQTEGQFRVDMRWPSSVSVRPSTEVPRSRWTDAQLSHPTSEAAVNLRLTKAENCPEVFAPQFQQVWQDMRRQMWANIKCIGEGIGGKQADWPSSERLFRDQT